ncbi:MAG: PD-(D/E)XK nuclease-like domain-containing protein, partial [Polyangiaceae bacterium]
SSGYSEASVFWIDEPTGIYCKARPDWVHENDDEGDTLIDLKSTADESASSFGRTAARMGYHKQAAHYVAGYEAATGRKVKDFVFAAVTNVQPVLAVPYYLIDEITEQGRDEVRELLDQFAACRDMGRWPAHTGMQPLSFPAYATRSNEIEVSYVE